VVVPTHTCQVDDICDHTHILRFKGNLDAAIRWFHGQVGPCMDVIFNGTTVVFRVFDEAAGPAFIPST
jgi:hypothetical protein